MALDNHLYITTGFIIEYGNNERSLQRVPIQFDFVEGDSWYVVIEGDSLTAISTQFYGDPAFWYLIADANEIFNPFDDLLETGLYLRIPSSTQIDQFNSGGKQKTTY